MNTNTPNPGTAMQGGFFAGIVNINSQHFGLIVSPKEAGEFKSERWGEPGKIISASSCFEGFENTQAMAEAGSEIAQKVLALQIGEFNDWYIPSRDELEIIYRNLKPATEENFCSFRDGDNASSVPTGYPYTGDTPAQTSCESFQNGNQEAFECAWYWSSTQYSANFAYRQYFAGGGQYRDHKDSRYRVRAVRRFVINSSI